MKWPLARRIWDSIVRRGPVIPRTDRDRAFVTIHTPLESKAGATGAPAALRRWKVAGLVSLAVIVAAVPLSLLWPSRPSNATDPATVVPAFVGSTACQACHENAYRAWKGSHHERAMDVATEATVLGDFDNATFTHRGVTSRFYRRDGKFYVTTQGPDGTPGEFEITHVFGLTPLQQYLDPVSRRAQAEPHHRVGHGRQALVPPLSRPGHSTDRLAALDAERAELERHVRGVSLDQPEEELRRRHRHVRDHVV